MTDFAESSLPDALRIAENTARSIQSDLPQVAEIGWCCIKARTALHAWATEHPYDNKSLRKVAVESS